MGNQNDTKSKGKPKGKNTPGQARRRFENPIGQAYLTFEEIQALMTADPAELQKSLGQRVRLDPKLGVGSIWMRVDQLAVLLHLLANPDALAEALKNLQRSKMKLEANVGEVWATPAEMAELLNIAGTPGPVQPQVVDGSFSVVYDPEASTLAFAFNGVEGAVSTLVPVAKGMLPFFEALAEALNIPADQQERMFKPYRSNGHSKEPVENTVAVELTEQEEALSETVAA